MKKSVNLLSVKNNTRICAAALLSSMPKIYATEGYKVFPVYFVAGLLIMLIAHRLRTNKLDQWLLDFAILSAFFTVSSEFGFSSLLWFLWIALVCFVTLRQKPNFKIFKVITANLLIFAILFSAVEMPLRLSESSDDHPNFNLGLVSNSKNFVHLNNKDYFRKALEQSKLDSVFLGPNKEFIKVIKEKIKSSGDLVFLDDFSGEYIKIQSGRRLTVGSTGVRQKRVLVFGGSTIFCGEVPDSMTVASELQKILSDKKIEIDVVNYGIPGIRIENQFQILQTVDDLGPRDLVIFYDGVNDLNTIFRLGLESNKSVIPLGIIKKIVAWFEGQSLLVRGLISGYIDSKGISKEFLSSEAEKDVNDLWVGTDQLARAYVESRGAKFVHILQPNWLTFKGGVEATTDNKRWADMKMIQNIFEKYIKPETKTENFTKILDGLSTTPYIDWAHLDEIGNKKVAEEMFAVIQPLLKQQSK